MKILVVLAHPNPGSFNHAIAAAAVAELESLGHEVCIHDLYADGFDPAMPAEELARSTVLCDDIARRCADLAISDGIVVIHPNWWGQPPAILKGWLDRVMRPGVAYEFRARTDGRTGPVGLLRLRCALVVNTGNTPMAAELAQYGDPLDNLWKKCVFGMCEVPCVERRYFTSVIVSTPEERGRWLGETRSTVAELFPSD
jgi:putative NADPH-quinone reductase